MITNEVYGIIFIILGSLILYLKDRFYIFKEYKYDKHLRFYYGSITIFIGLWNLFIINLDNNVVKWVNINASSLLLLLNILALAIFTVLLLVNIFNAKKK